MNWLDRAILWMSPQWAMKRERARMLARHYEAASVGRRTEGWSRRGTDANAAASGATLLYLRAQARDLVRNNPWARKGLRRIVGNTVGWGIRPKPTGRGADRIMALWKLWAETTQCDSAGRLTMYGLQRLAMRTIAESGEVLIRRRWRRPEDGLAVPMQLQILEPDHLDSSRDGMIGVQGGPIIQGVEFDAIGRRVAYWMFDQHPGGLVTPQIPASRRIPADGVLHVYDQERAGQVRGPSWFASVDVRLHDFAEFEDATIVKQKIAACLAVLVSDIDGGPGAGLLGQAGTDASSGKPTDMLEPGMIVSLQPGKNVTVANPPAATDHQSFSATSLRGVAAGLPCITYEDLTGDFCVAPETRVLRADLRWAPAEALTEGDEIIGFDEEPPGGRGNRRKWRKASVVRTGRRDLCRIRIVTDGATVTVSDEHLFLCTTREPTGAARGTGLQARSKNPETPGCGQRWVRADRIQPGDQIVFLCAPWETGRSYIHGYLKGMADGEGYLDRHDAKIGIAQNPGPVFDELGVALAELGFIANHLSANGGHKVQTWSLQGIGECLRFLGEVRPTRLLRYADTVYDGRMMSGGAKKSGRPTAVTVQAVEDLGVGPVITLETSTRTFIAEGMCSHNSHVNYSSARMARIGARSDRDDLIWNMLVPQLCQPAWTWMLDAMILAGEQVEQAPAEWSPAPMPMLDPKAEAEAYCTAIRNGLMTLAQAIRELGYDPFEQLSEVAEINEELDRLGIKLDCDPRSMTSAGQLQFVSSGAKPSDGAGDTAAKEGDASKASSDKKQSEEATPKSSPPKPPTSAPEKPPEVKVFAYHQPFMKAKEIREGIGLPGDVEDGDLFALEFTAKHGGGGGGTSDQGDSGAGSGDGANG